MVLWSTLKCNWIFDKGEMMEKELTEVVFILDCSASMEGLEKETIAGFNSVIEKQKREKTDAYVTTVFFNDARQELHFRKPLYEVDDLTEQDYCVKGCTALLDAIGNTIYRLKIERIKHKRIGQVIVVIITDGMENASREFQYDILEKLILEMKEIYGWEFLFLGANMDAVKEAARIGISINRSVTYKNDSAGVALNYEIIGDLLTPICRSTACSSLIGKSWKEKIEIDYLNRESSLPQNFE